MTSRKGAIPFLLATLFLFFVSITAQDLDDAVLRGTVKDQAGDALPGAVVTVTSADSALKRRAVSDGSGRYRFVDLPPGRYFLSAVIKDFAPAAERAVELRPGVAFRFDIILQAAGITEQVDVAAEAGPSESGIAAGPALSAGEIRAIPNPGGDVLDLVFLLPGSDEEAFSTDLLADDDRIGSGSESDRPREVIGAGSYSLSGGAAYSTNITIDGLDNNDDRLAGARFQPPPDSVAEVQVVANQFSAEYGRASGGRINIRSRSGERAFRGSFSTSFEDESLNANTFNNNRRGLSRLPYTVVDPAFSVTGPAPLSRGRTRFFSTVQMRNRRSSSLIDTVVPVDRVPGFPLPPPTHPHEARVDDIPNPAVDSFPAVDIAPYRKPVDTPGTRLRGLLRLDHAFSPTHSAVVGFQFGRERDLRQYRETSRFLEETLQARRKRNDAVQFTDDLVVSDRVVNQFRFQFSDHRPGLAADSEDSPVVLVFVSDDGREGSPDRVRGTVVAGNSTANFANLRRERRYQLQDTVSIVSGRHTFRVGADLQRIDSDIRDLADASGTFNFSRVYDLIASQPSRYRRNFGSRSAQKNTYFGLFVQDDLQLTPGVTLNAGLRYERESIVSDRNNFGPRIAAAWSPGESGSTVLRFGAGVFYNRVLLRTLDDHESGRSAVRFDSEALAGPSSEARCLNQTVPGPQLSTDKCRFLAALAGRFPSAPDLAELRGMLSALGIVSGGFVTETNFTRFVEPGISVPESYQFSFSAERRLAARVFVEAGFVFNKASGLWRETNVNSFRPPPGFATLTDYLLGLGTFDLNGIPTRFEIGDPADLSGVSVEGEVRVVNLASPNGSEAASAPIGIAFAALEATLQRPFDPLLGQVEMVGASGRSVYEGFSAGLTARDLELPGGGRATLRIYYTFSRTRDDGSADTSSAQRAGDFRSEFSASAIDRRHRLRISGVVLFPKRLGGVSFSPVVRLESARPFNIGTGGSDRNLDDVGNDRPDFRGDTGRLVSRSAEQPLGPGLLESFSLPSIGTPGNLRRNAGRGPALFRFDASVSRRFSVGRADVELRITAANVLNATVYSFGSDFIDLSPARPTEFARGFLVPSRTLSQRKVSLGIRVEM